MNELNYFQFDNFIKHKAIIFNYDFENFPMSSSLKNAMLSLILRCPSGTSKLGVSFSELGLFSKTDFIEKIREVRKLLNIKLYDQYIWQDVYLQDEWFDLFKQFSSKNKSFIYMHKLKPHLETIFVSMRNAIAHGQFIIENRNITMWTVTKQKKIKSLMYMKTSRFIKIVEILNIAYKKV